MGIGTVCVIISLAALGLCIAAAVADFVLSRGWFDKKIVPPKPVKSSKIVHHYDSCWRPSVQSETTALRRNKKGKITSVKTKKNRRKRK